MNISNYFESLRIRILNDSFILHVDILRERNRSKNGHFRARLTFSDKSTLEFSEYIEQNADEIQLVTYSYHWVDSSGDLLRRWDNAPHHPNLPDFPNHVHDRKPENVVPGKPVNLFSILDEIAATAQK